MGIRVIDSIMGSGKSTYLIEELKRAYHHDLRCVSGGNPIVPRKFIVVVPLLTEVTRYIKECPDLNFREPTGLKGKHFADLIDSGANIVTTHSLFFNTSNEVASKIKDANYVLYIDEEPPCVSTFGGVSISDFEVLNKFGGLKIDEVSGVVTWDPEAMGNTYRGVFEPLQQLCQDRNLVYVKGTLYWVLSAELLKHFGAVTVCTYLFTGSFFDAWCQSEGIETTLVTLHDGRIVSLTEGTSEGAVKAALRGLIIVHEGERNAIGRPSASAANPLSMAWYKKATVKQLKDLKSSTETYFDKVAKTKSSASGWTTYKAFRSKLKGRGYTKGFIPSNAKATNEYAAKEGLAYLVNWFCSPSLTRYFEARGVRIDEDRYALSTLLQWVWRSRIREGKPINLFIPSQRMRKLLLDWLNADAPAGGNIVPGDIATPQEQELVGEAA